MQDFSQLPDVAPDYDLRDLLAAGCHFGHQAGDWHPDMEPWIYFQQDGIHIFDLEKTAEQLKKAYNYFYQLGHDNKEVIFVGTKRQAEEVIREQAGQAGAHWIISRWLGGLLTNWKQVSKSLRRMIEIEEGLSSDEFEMYTKYEQMQLEKDAQRLARFFDGLRGLKQLPDAIFVIDPQRESVAVKEAKIVGIPVIGLVDTNTNPNEIDLVIPANDDGRESIKLIVTELAEAYQRGQAEAAGEKPTSKPKKAKSKAPTDKKAESEEKEVKAKTNKKQPKAEKKKKEEKKSKSKEQVEDKLKAEKKPKEKTDSKKAKKVKERPEPTMSLTRDELDQLAEQEGIENPSSLPRKQAVIDAIKAGRK